MESWLTQNRKLYWFSQTEKQSFSLKLICFSNILNILQWTDFSFMCECILFLCKSNQLLLASHDLIWTFISNFSKLSVYREVNINKNNQCFAVCRGALKMIQHENLSLLFTISTRSPQVIKVISMRQLADQQNLKAFLPLKKIVL